MINTPKSIATDTIKFEVTEYPIGFPYFSNPDGTPQLKIMAGTEELQLDYNCKLSEDGQTLILIPTEEQAETLSDPEDYSWMLPLVGKQLVVERDVPFIQESDYQLGRISSEQIEKDLDKSVMRDQEIRNQADKDRATIQECQRNINNNAEAIQKARDDFSAEDAKINKRIDDHAEELDAIHEVQTTANTNIESNAKAIQKTRDDFTAADSVLRKDIDNNKSDIAKLRDDMNASDTSLQGQITAQTAKIATKQNKLTAGDNIIISGDVISATGAGGGAGLSLIVYDALPETGESGIIYLIPKDSEAPDVHDEYVWINATQTFELIGSTKVDLTDYATKGELAGYLPLSGGTLTGGINYADEFETLSEKDILTYTITNPDTYVNKTLSFTWKLMRDQTLAFVPSKPSTGGFKIGSTFFAPRYDGGYELGSGYYRIGTIYAKWLSSTKGSPIGNKLTIPDKVGTLATIEDITAIGGDGTTGQVLTKTDDGFVWQEPAGGTKVIFREWEE